MEVPSFQNLIVFSNTEKAPLDNKLVRQALSYAFPYGDVVEYAMGGYAVQGKGPIPVGHWGHGDDLFQYQHDLDKARELLAQAGYPDGGLELLLTYMAGMRPRKTAELFKAELAKIGINLEIRACPGRASGSFQGIRPQKRQDLLQCTGGLTTPVPIVGSTACTTVKRKSCSTCHIGVTQSLTG